MRGLKLWAGKEFVFAERSRIFYRCVDWNILSSTNVGRTNSRIFYRCVDWNLRERRSFFAMPSHLLQMRGLKRCAISRVASTALSHLLQMRGLKPWLSIFYIIFNRRIFYRCVDWNIFIGLGYARPLVASFTDAWIETRCCLCEDSCRESHLLQMRGLKLTFAVENSIWKVASFTDAWIETVRMRLYITLIFGRIFYRCVDWNCDEESIVMGIMCRIFYRCVDWNKAS